MRLNRVVQHTAQHTRDVELDDRDVFTGCRRAHGVDLGGGIQHQQACRIDFGPAFGDPVLHRLAGAQWPAGSQFAVGGTAAEQVERSFADADPAHTVVDAARPQPLLGQREARARRSDAVSLWHAAGFVADFAVAGVAFARLAHHGQIADMVEAGRGGRDDDLAGALVRGGRWVGDGHDDSEGRAVCRRGEPLVAVDHIIRPVRDRRGIQPDRVGAGVFRLGHRKATAGRATRQGPQKLLLLGGAAVGDQQFHVAGVGRLAIEQIMPDGTAAQLLADFGKGAQRQAPPAERDRDLRCPQPRRLHRLPQRV